MTKEVWLVENGASPQALSALREALPLLPPSYLDLLSRGNGGEAGLAAPPLILVLDPAEDALSFWHSGVCTMEGVFVFGGNGGLELLAFDMRGNQPWPVISFDPIDPDGSVETLADDFPAFLRLVEAI
ncbi:SMI1/KNR4 family protein [Dyella mobilis]|uniref:SMI1/KNR4 family protein n=1 Tax=Dyella mobilis TaxID=1849582 RepID=A0ABS2KDX9_9GAMM|nr:SMI1/KNR4 family protein [Dyella mobilis]MBM7129384.1 SMI1/KNR4 family protein [Dyella mobilis]GLQ98350.1 hypothetical protein GCM10007863_27700 [Dyella mobilis]